MYVRVTRLHSPLECETWEFVYLSNEHTLRCSKWSRQTRPTKRHKFQDVEYYNAYERRQNTVTQPVIPEDIEAEAIREFATGLTVTHFK